MPRTESLLFHESVEKPQDNCAVVGIFSRTYDISSSVFNGLIELNHRGQEGSGILITDGEEIVLTKGAGLASIVFGMINVLPNLDNAVIGIGHNRYSTSGSLEELQPFLDDGIGIAHNGNLTNIEELRRKYDIAEEIDGSRSDTRIALAVINEMEGDAGEKIVKGVEQFEGAYSMVFATKDALFASRDPHGFRPLSIGRLRDSGGYIVMSETSGFSTGTEFIRDVLPGETIMIDDDGVKTIGKREDANLAQCIFELIYISRPDSNVFGISVVEFRLREGEILSRHMPDVDVIMPVPRSGISAAQGVASSEIAKEKKIPYIDGIYTNPYRNVVDGPRTFIQPNGRDKAATQKYSINEAVVRGKRVVLVDDSLVRGSLRIVVEKLREAGAREVHALIASPPIEDGCFYGVDFGKDEVLAHKMPDIEERRKYLGLDSLYYLSEAELLEAALGNPVEIEGDIFEQNGFCGGCFTGRYPTKVSDTIVKINEMQHVS